LLRAIAHGARDNCALLALPRSSAGIDAAAFLPDGRLITYA
jgi:hypothetical protein